MGDTWLLSSIFKKYCIICGEVTDSDLGVCEPCVSELPLLKNHCRLCAETLPLSENLCGRCLTATFHNLNTMAMFYYATPIDRLIRDLKFGSNLMVAKALGKMLAKYLLSCFRKEKPEVIVPIPLHSSRLKQRGYNQALEISIYVSKALEIPLDKFSITRVKNTQAQAQLGAKDRRHNVRGAFRVSAGFAYRHVALVDDVITTGSTAMELAKTLVGCGVTKIDLWCCAKSSLGRS